MSVDPTVVRAHRHAAGARKGGSATIAHTIPERADQVRNRARRGSRGGRPPVFDREIHKRRNVVERCFDRLNQWRGIATRYDKTAESHKAAVTLASLLMRA